MSGTGNVMGEFYWLFELEIPLTTIIIIITIYLHLRCLCSSRPEAEGANEKDGELLVVVCGHKT